MIHGRGAPARAPHIVSVSVPGTDSESMLMALDLRGIGCSAGSACQSGSISPSHVLSAIGVEPDLASSAIRMSLGSLTTDACIDRVAEVFPALVEQGARRGAQRELTMKERVLVAMSGGVDSSVAAAMLVEQGYDVVGATMKLFCHGDDLPDRPCCSLDSVNDARRVCQQLGVPHYVLNLESAFGRDVVDDFVNEYANGRTPIPCVRCNTFTKFRDLLVKADAIDAKWIATGHYARTADGELLRGSDHAKDQSYFLWGIDRSRAAPHAAAGRLADEGGDARRRAPARPRAHRREGGESGHLLRARRRPHEDHSPAPRCRRAVAVAGSVRPLRRHAGGHARRIRALHDRSAARTARRIPRADVRRRDSPARSRRRDRSARGAARPRRGCATR